MLTNKMKNLKELMGNTNFVTADDGSKWTTKNNADLWNNLVDFTLPGREIAKFDPYKNEMFLGAILVFRNAEGENEIARGQAKLAAIHALLRACYEKCRGVKNDRGEALVSALKRCIFQTDELWCVNEKISKFGTKIENETYDQNYQFFKTKVDELASESLEEFLYFTARILNNCLILEIKAGSKEAAEKIHGNF